MPSFREIWAIDFEFIASAGDIQRPVCVVAKEVNTGEVRKIWLQGNRVPCPFSVDEDVLYIAYYSSAEWGCFLSMGWPLPTNVLDLFTEFRAMTNGKPGISSSGLLGACSYFGISTIADMKKNMMRDRIIQGPPYSEQEKQDILEYCESDVTATVELFQKMYLYIDLQRALFRGEYMKAIANMEFNGIPIDLEVLNQLKANWDFIREALIKEVDKNFEVYEGTTFKVGKFREYLQREGILWPVTEKGNLELKDDTFKSMVKTYPRLQPLRDLRYILGQLRLTELAVGPDGRNRCLLSPFRTKTGRNAPSNSKFIFGPAVWLRSLIKPEPGRVLAYIDFSQQEFYIAAVLSGDQNMKKAYESGDPYLTFAIQAGAAPEGATKSTHKEVRDLFKTCALGVQYGMESHSLALQIGQTPAHAENLIRHHKRVFHQYWKWLDHVLNSTIIGRKISTCYGWQFFVTGNGAKEARTIRNFPAQATGAEILRVACILLMEAGIKIIAPVHDAIMIECDESEAEEQIALAQKLMSDASEFVIGKGNRIRTEVDVLRYPDRYSDPRGKETWDKIMNILGN